MGRGGPGRGRGEGEAGGIGLARPLSSLLRGFCFFNSVAIACRQLQQQGKAGKILIVDWVGLGSRPLQA